MILGSPTFRNLFFCILIPPAIAIVVLIAGGASRGMISYSALAALLSAWLLALAFSRSWSKRVSRLRFSAQDLLHARLFQGNGSEPNDDLDSLARALDQTSGNLRELVGRLSDESGRRQAILSSMIEGVVTVDRELLVTFCNHSFLQLLEIPATVKMPVPMVELVRNPEMAEMLRTVLSSQQPVSRRLQWTSAEPRTFDAHAGPLGESSRAGAVLILHDITSLERLERVRKDFVANVSHELRTPLTAICGYAEALLDGALDDKEHNRRFVEIIDTHAKRLNRIASDLLTLSELESVKAAAVSEPISVKAALKSAFTAAEPEATQRGIKLICGAINDVEVLGIRVHFEQAVLNLLQNAVKFNRPGGEVRLSTQAVNGRICISVADTGVGIPSEDLSRIFERFYRVDKARSRDVGGTGLGLSIVKHAIERMNGTVEVESHLGTGSEFKIWVPVAAA